MQLIDTHCHIHENDYPLDSVEVLERAQRAGVSRMICVGTNYDSSEQAVEFANAHKGIYASIGVHPHDTVDGIGDLGSLNSDKIVAVGEIGLDYFYAHSPRETQIEVLKTQIELALARDLPIVFHVREAFDDFWPIFDSYTGIRGELHSFTDSMQNMQQALKRGLYIGVNGISTFTKNSDQQKVFASIPLDHLLLETDAPFLTPTPFRGKVNEPAFVVEVAKHHAQIRNISVDEVATATTRNANALFNLR